MERLLHVGRRLGIVDLPHDHRHGADLALGDPAQVVLVEPGGDLRGFAEVAVGHGSTVPGGGELPLELVQRGAHLGDVRADGFRTAVQQPAHDRGALDDAVRDASTPPGPARRSTRRRRRGPGDRSPPSAGGPGRPRWRPASSAPLSRRAGRRSRRSPATARRSEAAARRVWSARRAGPSRCRPGRPPRTTGRPPRAGGRARWPRSPRPGAGRPRTGRGRPGRRGCSTS